MAITALEVMNKAIRLDKKLNYNYTSRYDYS